MTPWLFVVTTVSDDARPSSARAGRRGRTRTPISSPRCCRKSVRTLPIRVSTSEQCGLSMEPACRLGCRWPPWVLASFSAFGYQDGLPGNGWDRETMIAWDGQRQADVLGFAGQSRDGDPGAGRRARDRRHGRRSGARAAKCGAASTTLDAAPPAAAIVLFDGSGVTRFDPGHLTPEGWLAPGAVTRLPVKDFQLHVEFQIPYMPYARDQARGNSGVYIQRRYEVQILDSFGLPPVFNGCGGTVSPTEPRAEHELPATRLADLRHLLHGRPLGPGWQQDFRRHKSRSCITACRSIAATASLPRRVPASPKRYTTVHCCFRTMATPCSFATSGWSVATRTHPDLRKLEQESSGSSPPPRAPRQARRPPRWPPQVRSADLPADGGSGKGSDLRTDGRA